MRIERLELDGFGHFSGQEFRLATGGLTVIEGQNEAGKSTLLAFIRTMLFGWPARARGEYYPPLRGGRHGGRVDVCSADGGRYRIGRWEDSRGARLQVTLPDGRETSDEGLLARLRGHATRAQYQSIFAFGLDELRDWKALSDGDVTQQIYAAGIGARRVPGALKQIDNERSGIFTPGGRSHRVAGLLDELERVEGKLRTLEEQASRYACLSDRQGAIESEIGQAECEAAQLREALRETEKLRQAWNPWVRWRELSETVAALPPATGFPEDGVARLEAVEERLRREKDDVQEAVTELEQWQDKAGREIPDSSLLEESIAIGDLARRLAQYRAWMDDLPKRRTEAAEKRKDVTSGLAELGVQWDAERVQRVDTSLPAQDAVARFRDSLQQAQAAADRAAEAEQRQREEVGAAREELERLQIEHDELPMPPLEREELAAQQGWLKEARLRAETHRSAGEEYRLRAAEAGPVARPSPGRDPGWLGVAGLILLGLLGLLIGLLTRSAAGIVAGLGSALIATGGVVLLVRGDRQRRASPSRSDGVAQWLEAARAREEETGRSLREALRALGMDNADAAALEQAGERLDEARRLLERRESAGERLREATQKRFRAAEHHAAATQLAAAARNRCATLQEEWRGWLQARGLDQSWTAELTLVIFARIDAVRAHLRSFKDTAQRIRGMEDGMAAYKEEVAAICARAGRPIQTDDDAEIGRIVDLLVRGLGEAQRGAERKAEAEDRMAASSANLERLRSRSEATEDEIAALLSAGGVEDSEAFRARAAEVNRRLAAEQEARECEAGLRGIAGPSEGFEQLTRALSAVDLPTLEARFETLSEAERATRERYESLRDERTANASAIAELEHDGEAAVPGAQREQLISELGSAARRWAELTLAGAMIEQTRERYERERQPAVVRDASTLFGAITGGRYSRVLPGMERESLSVESAAGRQTRVEQLSRGTQEQLYLAMRFGLIRQFAESAVALPVVVDEVLVDFDPERAAKVAQAFTMVAQTNQVLVFTCHPWVTALFREAGACSVVDLAMPGAQA